MSSFTASQTFSTKLPFPQSVQREVHIHCNYTLTILHWHLLKCCHLSTQRLQRLFFLVILINYKYMCAVCNCVLTTKQCNLTERCKCYCIFIADIQSLRPTPKNNTLDAGLSSLGGNSLISPSPRGKAADRRRQFNTVVYPPLVGHIQHHEPVTTINRRSRGRHSSKSTTAWGSVAMCRA